MQFSLQIECGVFEFDANAFALGFWTNKMICKIKEDKIY